MDEQHRQQALRMAEVWDEMARDLDRARDRCLSGVIKATYDRVVHEPLPDVFRDRLKQLETAEQRQR